MPEGKYRFWFSVYLYAKNNPSIPYGDITNKRMLQSESSATINIPFKSIPLVENNVNFNSELFLTPLNPTDKKLTLYFAMS